MYCKKNRNFPKSILIPLTKIILKKLKYILID